MVGEEIVADYLLYWLNKNEEFDYVSALGLSSPTDDIRHVLLEIASQRNLYLKTRHFDGNGSTCTVISKTNFFTFFPFFRRLLQGFP